MILYFDNLIIDEPLRKGIYLELDEIRNSDSVYKRQSKIDITLYSIASYAELDWSKVIIKYEINDDKNGLKRKYFEKEVRKLFPKENLYLIHGRSDCQEKFRESLKLINSLKDEWIFYTGDVDHPFMAPDKKTLSACLEELKKLNVNPKHISIHPTHFTELLNVSNKLNPVHELTHPKVVKLKETKDCLVSLFPTGLCDSTQIFHKDLLNYIFNSCEMEGIIRRSEDVRKFVKIKNQIIISPKKEIIAHFDGYSHSKSYGYFIPSDLVPPLFIPPGFFEKKIKIAFGYDEYREGWVNINPLKEKYSFRDKINGTDLMIDLNEIPLFWKKRISEIDVNPNANMKEISKVRKHKLELVKNPWKKKGKLFYFFYKLRIKLRWQIRWKMKKIPKIFTKPCYFIIKILVNDYSLLKPEVREKVSLEFSSPNAF